MFFKNLASLHINKLGIFILILLILLITSITKLSLNIEYLKKGFISARSEIDALTLELQKAVIENTELSKKFEIVTEIDNKLQTEIQALSFIAVGLLVVVIGLGLNLYFGGSNNGSSNDQNNISSESFSSSGSTSSSPLPMEDIVTPISHAPEITSSATWSISNLGELRIDKIGEDVSSYYYNSYYLRTFPNESNGFICINHYVDTLVISQLDIFIELESLFQEFYPMDPDKL